MPLIAYFYSNDVPCSLAVQLYHACNDKADEHTTELFYDTYDAWLRSEHEVHLAIYYNMRIGRYLYINGSRMNQSELVDSEISYIVLGFGSIFPQHIMKKIDRIRTQVFYH